ncbi:MAG: DHA2 family efflux MFS transporter permease subunit [Xanthomonadales bacterium]|nr:DHA2 family efflux MFS transporter permease subunit [Xanthomonadales bacterium]
MRASRRLPLIVACALFIENMDSTVLSTALPAIAHDFGVDPISLKLVLTSYLLALAVFIPISGWVADRFGARITFMSAIAVFLLGSVGCAASPSLEWMVLARFVQGMGGAMMVPVGRLVLLRTVEKSELVQALSWLTIPALVGPVAGPPLGGFITTWFDWRWIFLINLPMGALGIALAWRYIPALKEPVQALDWPGFLLSGFGLALAMFGFSTLGHLEVPLWASIAVLLLGVAGLVVYGVRARRVEYPLLDLRLFRIPTYKAGVLGGSLFRIGVGAVPFLLPLMLQVGFGLSPLQSGGLTFVSAVGAMFMKTIAAWIIRQWGFRRVLVFNALLSSASLAIYGLFRPSTPHLLVMTVLLVSGCMRSLQFTSLNAVSYADVGQLQISQASSLAAMMQQLSVSVGVAVAGLALQACGWLRHVPTTDVHNFYLAFPLVALISALSAIMMWRLPADAGADMAGRARAGHEVAEPKVEQRPAM